MKLRIGFVTGSLTKVGSGRSIALPLARALSKLGCSTYGLEPTHLCPGETRVNGLRIMRAPVLPHLLKNPARTVKDLLQRRKGRAAPFREDRLDYYDHAVGHALLALVEQLRLDVLYVFHNINVARVLKGWPHPSRILVINLIGFGIDPSRGGAANTFPLQHFIFARPYWDLHIAATGFEFKQYRQVYRDLGLDSIFLLHLPHPYDEDLFYPPSRHPPPPPFVADEDARILVYPVNVYPRKNIEMAIDVLALLKEKGIKAHLIVTGTIWDKVYHAHLVERAERRKIGGQIHFLKGVASGRMRELYHQADLIIFTSHQETFGVGMVEALACGTPVVGPDWIMACRDILSGLPGGWLAPKDVEGFASVLLEALRAEHNPSQIAEATRLRYGNLTVARRFLDAVGEIKRRKEARAKALRAVNWKALYCDAGDLL